MTWKCLYTFETWMIINAIPGVHQGMHMEPTEFDCRVELYCWVWRGNQLTNFTAAHQEKDVAIHEREEQNLAHVACGRIHEG
eukprot:3152908-Amphidinium_carterae.2